MKIKKYSHTCIYFMNYAFDLQFKLCTILKIFKEAEQNNLYCDDKQIQNKW